MNREKDICKEIGAGLKNLRIKNGYSSYENFAVEHGLSRMQYWRIEKGLTNLTIRSLITLLNIHKVSIEEFFLNIHRFKADGKPHKQELKSFKSIKSFEHDGHIKHDGQVKRKNK
ncbi:MAG: helix-turn-helix domain-containing protein [Bacteroidia bacterium]